MIRGSNSLSIGDLAGYDFIQCIDEGNGGYVRLNHQNNLEKLRTTSTGINVTGTVNATAFVGDGSNLTGVDAVITQASPAPTGQSTGALWFNTTDKVLYVHDGTEFIPVYAPPFSATGGTESTSGSYKVHTFTTSGSFITTSAGVVDIFVLAGGGSGGAGHYSAGGGAGGGYKESIELPIGTYTVTVGAGASAPHGDSYTTANGSNSSFGTSITCIGGGGGAHDWDTGNAGGCGGGGSGNGSAPGGNSTQTGSKPPYYGNSGGNSGSNYAAGGGGGLNGPGIPGTNGQLNITGGPGLELNDWGTSSSWYGAGGSGWTYDAGGYTGRASGIGGMGTTIGNTSKANMDAIVNTGSGGGGLDRREASYAGNGSSGIVIVRYAV
jgi:hypothetical protein